LKVELYKENKNQRQRKPYDNKKGSKLIILK